MLPKQKSILLESNTNSKSYLNDDLDYCFQDSPIAGCLVQKGVIEATNRPFQKLCGHQEMELVGMRVSQLFFSPQKPPIPEEQIDFTQEFKLLSTRTGFLPVLEICLPFRYRGEKASIVYVIDYSEQKKEVETTVEYDRYLGCLSVFGFIGKSRSFTLDDVCRAMVNILPACFQYPRTVRLRVTIGEKEFQSKNYEEIVSKISSTIMFHGQPAGILEVGRAATPRKLGNSLFSTTEHKLIQSSSELLGRVAEYKQAEETLLENEEQLRTILDSVHEGIAVLDLKGNILRINDCLAVIHGYDSKKELIGQNYSIFIARKHHRKIINNLERTIKHGTSGISEYTCLRRGGEEFPAELGITLLRDSLGYPLRLLAVSRDISRCKQAEQSLFFERIRSKTILDSHHDLIYIINRDYDFEYTNPATPTHFGPIDGKKCYQYLHEREDPCPFCQGEGVFLGNTTEDEWHCPKTKRYYEVVCAPLLNTDGSYSKCVVLRDVTEKRLAWKELEDSREFSRSLLDNSPNPIIVLETDTAVKYSNPAFEKLTGYSCNETIGKKAPYPWYLEDRANTRNGSRRVYHNGLREAERVFKKKDGGKFWVEVKETQVKGEDGSIHYLQNWIDITEQKKLRDNLRYYIAEVHKAQEVERKRIARELHDELAQNLSSLFNDIDVIRENGNLSNDDLRRLHRLRSTIAQGLDRVRSFSHRLRPAILDDFGLVPSIELLTEEMKKTEGIDCCVRIAGLSRRIPNDLETEVFRIVQESLRNIQKHSEATCATVTVKFYKRKLALTVCDNGKGFNVPKTLVSLVNRGSLGLIGIQERVHLLNGKLSVNSIVGRGSTISIAIPLQLD